MPRSAELSGKAREDMSVRRNLKPNWLHSLSRLVEMASKTIQGRGRSLEIGRREGKYADWDSNPGPIG